MHKRVETTHTRAPTHAHTQADPAMQTHTASYVHTQQHPHTDTQIPITHTQTYTGGKDILNITKNAMHTGTWEHTGSIYTDLWQYIYSFLHIADKLWL